MAQEIIEAPASPTPASLNPYALLDKAISSGASPDIIMRLMDAQERYENRLAQERHEARLAHKAFDAAMLKARQEIPNIHKAKKGHGYNYAALDDIARTIIPVLAKYGLSYRWYTSQEGESIKVTCVLVHEQGHREENSMIAPAAAAAVKMQNSIQAKGSAVTYLQRYTLTAALGLSSSNDDDGAGVAHDTTPINDNQRDHLIALLDEHDINVQKFCAYLGVSYIGALPASDYPRALSAINRRISQTRQELHQTDKEQNNE